MMIETQVREEKDNLEINKLLDYIMEQPTWIKHYIYSEIKENLSYILNIDSQYINHAYVQKFVPLPAAEFQILLKKRFNSSLLELKNITEVQLKFLKSVEKKQNLMEICNENCWSLKECCQILVLLIDKKMIEQIDCCYLASSIYYLAGKIRLCEYLVRMNKVSLEQVDKALFVQQEIVDETGGKDRIGDLLVKMGYINEEDKADILCLKENSELSCNLVDETEVLKHKINELEIKLESLDFEKECYKQDLVDFQEELYRQSEIIAELQDIKLKKEKNGSGLHQSLFKKLFHNQLT